MPQPGTLRTWHDDRGFGFIAPSNGGRELFVHISAFPKDGSRPTVGESLTYDVGEGKDGKPQAVRVYRQALGQPSTYPASRRSAPSSSRRSPLMRRVGLAMVAIALLAYGYNRYQKAAVPYQPADEAPLPLATSQQEPRHAAPSRYTCDGRTHCSQMTSCDEATFFLKNCPTTEMDGDNDGRPCEQQWCDGASFK